MEIPIVIAKRKVGRPVGSGGTHIVGIKISTLLSKFADTNTMIPVSKKFAEMLGLEGIRAETSKQLFETIQPAEKNKIDFKVENFEE